MSLSLAEVFERAGRQEMAYIRDGVIHFVVLTRKDNTWTTDRIRKYLLILD